MRIVILTGYSGSGKSTAIRYFEEYGFYCVDNLPGQMLKDFVQLITEKDHISKVAIVIDARGKDFLKDLDLVLDELAREHDLKIVFFECGLPEVTKRFKESRLRHPLSLTGTIKEGYDTEKTLLSGLRHRADVVIDSSNLNVHALKVLIHKYIRIRKGYGFEIHLMSFGYKFGVPQEADFVIDVRFLNNPYFVKTLRKRTGKNPKVQEYILKDPATLSFFKHTERYLRDVLKRHKVKGKPFVTIAFGCTGGRHRSVFVTEKFKSLLKKGFPQIKTYHRDMALE